MTITPAQWNRWRYTAYAPFYDVLVRPFQEARKRAIEQLELQAGERVLIIGQYLLRRHQLPIKTGHTALGAAAHRA